ncbi:TetR/AcrR family transcriptional regulator [Janthinobacterium fluminis]|uniref:TetR/AcrR family transcriptional regulator n=1 Tax=Janthinobacterium fluminis TaxID=2987524 RepID=A0ABT5JWG5_9BURK|nr:TetR/AcrR family transcriptional regulator [Janthinobacterium fluminis]MDC8757081.1 TetR/AcrR family transcriptional regulator [Janthinobacterium fluminis]
MNPPDIQAQSTDRKSAILAAALAVFSEKGIEATTIDDIRQRSQASVGSIYHHFGNKESIAAALFALGLDDYWGQLIARTRAAPDAEQAIRALLTTHLDWIVAKPDLARFLFARRQAVSPAHEQAIRDLTAAHFKEFFALFKPWFKQGILRRLPFELYGPLLLGPAQELSRHWLGGRVGLDPRSAAGELSRAAWLSLAADAAPPSQV